jgi:non-heme chloroperoxidase
MNQRFARVVSLFVLYAPLSGCAHRPAELVPAVRPAAAGLRAVQVNGTVLNHVDSVQAAAPHDARPVVLVHGTLGYYGEWRNQVAAFSATRRTISYSRRYHLPNAQVEDGKAYSPQLHADDLAAFIRALNLGPVDLVGSSYGGATVLAFAEAHPEMVHSLVLAEPAINLYTNPLAEDSVRRFAAASIEGIDSSRALFARGDSLAALRTFMDATIGPGSYDAAPEAARTYFRSQLFELGKEMSVPNDTWIPRTTCADLQPLKMPVLVLIGGRTLPVYHNMVEHLVACIPGATTATIPGVGHHLVENSVAFNAEVLRFLESIPR